MSPLPSVASGRFEAHTALVHADSSTPDVAELISEMAERTASGYVFGGLASSRSNTVQFALSGYGNVKGHGAASGVFSGGLSGVAFTQGAALMSRVTQGCQPVSRRHSITACEGNVVTELDGEPALDVLLAALKVTLEQPREALAKVRNTLVGLSDPAETLNDGQMRYPGQFGADVVVRHIIGLDPARKGIAVSEAPTVGMTLAFCERNAQAARSDLMRVCAEIRESLEPEESTLEAALALNAAEAEAAPHPARRIAGAIYVSCAGRGGPHFGAPSAELQIIRRALGDVPLVGFFAGGEIARHHLVGNTDVCRVRHPVGCQRKGLCPVRRLHR